MRVLWSRSQLSEEEIPVVFFFSHITSEVTLCLFTFAYRLISVSLVCQPEFLGVSGVLPQVAEITREACPHTPPKLSVTRSSLVPTRPDRSSNYNFWVLGVLEGHVCCLPQVPDTVLGDRTGWSGRFFDSQPPNPTPLR